MRSQHGPAADSSPEDRAEKLSMENRVVERRVRCPFCAESMTLLIDTSAGSQSYIEDCQICCQPMQVSFIADEGELHELRVDCEA